jgi:1-acyl-sn-glycerol-3-phosphate acyltransferase
VRDELARPALRPSAGALQAELPYLDATRRLLVKGFMLSFGRLMEVEGAERLAKLPEPAIFALNHSNSVESVLAPATLMYLRGGRSVHFLTDWMYLQIPVLGWLIRLGEPVPVYGKPARWKLREAYRQERRKEPVVEACLARLAAGGSLGIFPEGTRNPDPARLQRGRGGLGEIVLRSAAPVMPVGLHYPAAERLGRAPRLGRLVVRFGEPMPFLEERAAAAGLAAGRARRDVARGVVCGVMDALQELSGKAHQPLFNQRRAA